MGSDQSSLGIHSLQVEINHYDARSLWQWPRVQNNLRFIAIRFN